MNSGLAMTGPNIGKGLATHGVALQWLCVVVLAAAAFVYPMALLLLVCLVAVAVPDQRGRWWFLAAACVFLTIANSSKTVMGDLQNYVAIQDYIANRPFMALFDRDNMLAISGSYRPAELGFYGPCWLLAHLLNDSRMELAIFATFGIYVPTFMGVMTIARASRWNYGVAIGVVALVFFAAINFVPDYPAPAPVHFQLDPVPGVCPADC